jgi:hypothetical protein
MELMLQTKKRLWSVSFKGIHTVDTWEWDRVKDTFDSLFEYQSKTLNDALERQGPVGEAIDRTVKEGVAVAATNAESWRHPNDFRLPNEDRERQ